MVIALLLDLANILGGLLLVTPLLADTPAAGAAAATWERLHPFLRWIAVVALAAAGYFVIVHLFEGPHLFHYEVVGLLVGVALLVAPAPAATDVPRHRHRTVPPPAVLVLAVLGIVAVVTGIQGLFTPDG